MSDLAAALGIVRARWAFLVVERLLEGPQRHGDLHRELGVPTNMLATRPRKLEAAGVPLPLRHTPRRPDAPACKSGDRVAQRRLVIGLRVGAGVRNKAGVSTDGRAVPCGSAMRDGRMRFAELGPRDRAHRLIVPIALSGSYAGASSPKRSNAVR